MQYTEDLVSIIIIRKDTPLETTDRAVSSAKSQTWPKVQIIFVDDGSLEEPWSSTRSNCDKYIRWETNKGIPHARNAGLDAADGEYIFFLDSDDVLCYNCIEKLIETSKRENSDVTISGHYALYPSTNTQGEGNVLYWVMGGIWTVVKKFSSSNPDEPRQLLKRIISDYDLSEDSYGSERSNGAICTPWGKLYRHELIDVTGTRFDPSCLVQEDTLFNLQLFHKADYIYYDPTPLYGYSLQHQDVYQKEVVEKPLVYENWISSELRIYDFLESIGCVGVNGYLSSAMIDRMKYTIQARIIPMSNMPVWYAISAKAMEKTKQYVNKPEALSLIMESRVLEG